MIRGRSSRQFFTGASQLGESRNLYTNSKPENVKTILYKAPIGLMKKDSTKEEGGGGGESFNQSEEASPTRCRVSPVFWRGGGEEEEFITRGN